VVKFTARHREAMDLVKFIDAHGSRLGAFRAYGGAPVTPPSTSPAAPDERV
jgi:hypothetical protein